MNRAIRYEVGLGQLATVWWLLFSFNQWWFPGSIGAISGDYFTIKLYGNVAALPDPSTIITSHNPGRLPIFWSPLEFHFTYLSQNIFYFSHRCWFGTHFSGTSSTTSATLGSSHLKSFISDIRPLFKWRSSRPRREKGKEKKEKKKYYERLTHDPRDRQFNSTSINFHVFPRSLTSWTPVIPHTSSISFNFMNTQLSLQSKNCRAGFTKSKRVCARRCRLTLQNNLNKNGLTGSGAWLPSWWWLTISSFLSTSTQLYLPKMPMGRFIFGNGPSYESSYLPRLVPPKLHFDRIMNDMPKSSTVLIFLGSF